MLLHLPAQADEWWAWSWLEFWQQPGRSAGVFLANREDSEDGSYTQLVSSRYKQELLPWLDMGIGLSVLNLENTVSNERHWQLRPELELNPHLELTPHLRIDWRNRMEWPWNEEESLKAGRFRHRIQLGWTLPHSIGPWTRFFISNEWLVNLGRGQWTENRVVPLGLTFKAGKRTDLDVFYMINSTMPKETWIHESVIGTYLRVRF
ncbi:MAG: DUF2490 domain-containing protein [Verrucomicrobiaceae bacterium]|nr:DUF2490 domain-containing protein [Verrucomicrobiaceae bacterium]